MKDVCSGCFALHSSYLLWIRQGQYSGIVLGRMLRGDGASEDLPTERELNIYEFAARHRLTRGRRLSSCQWTSISTRGWEVLEDDPFAPEAS
jgi:hypothetical protein